MFIVPGKNVMKPISSMPGVYNISVDTAVEDAKRYQDLGIQSVLLFAIPDFKDDTGSAAWQDEGIIQKSIRAIKEQVPGMNVITDLCFCEYTSHGHCGIMHDGCLDNDATLDIRMGRSSLRSFHRSSWCVTEPQLP
jgi:porphobilinogen synthase